MYTNYSACQLIKCAVAIYYFMISSNLQIPTLVLGPFGCGKTRTMQECISVLSRYVPDVHILICTHTNSAADIYVESIHSDWLSK